MDLERANVNHKPIHGCLAAAVTPLTEDGAGLDEAAFGSLTDFMATAGLDGVLAMGTTGEGILLDLAERRRVVDLFVAAAAGRLQVVAHCGAQTTRDTALLAEHSAAAGAAGVAVIAPPYYDLNDASILKHFTVAGRACAPLPFYIYEFAARSGYPVPLGVIAELRQRLPNLQGLKVSDAPWDRFEPYLVDGLDIFVGPETLIHQGLEGGAVGAVSALATALPELVIDAVRGRTAEASARCGAARDQLLRYPFHSALKTLLARRGVALSGAVRAPLRRLRGEELNAFQATATELLSAVSAAPA